MEHEKLQEPDYHWHYQNQEIYLSNLLPLKNVCYHFSIQSFLTCQGRRY